ncbi:MAG: ATP synthase protein I [Paracoccaceae bacterium]|jgi:ATP synthase protein I
MPDPEDAAAAKIARGAERLQKMRDAPPPSPLRGLGTFGMIGWSVAAPTVGGVFLGRWLDRIAPQNFSWTIALLLGGACVGGIIAWRWVDREGGPEE